MLYPVYLNLKNENVLVIGGGNVAKRKIKQLLSTGARIICIAGEIKAVIKKYRKVLVIEKEFETKDIKKYNPLIIINATGNPEIDELILKNINKKNILYNSVDNPESCNFFTPAVIVKKNLIISISTQGRAPVMASYIKEKIKKYIKEEWVTLIEIISKVRKKLKNSQLSPREKGKIYHKIINNKKIKKGIKKELINKEVEKIIPKKK